MRFRNENVEVPLLPQIIASQYLNIKCLSETGIIQMGANDQLPLNFQYKIDNGNWTNVTPNSEIALTLNQIIYFKGEQTISHSFKSGNIRYTIGCAGGTLDISGELNSLYNFADYAELPDSAFQALFRGTYASPQYDTQIYADKLTLYPNQHKAVYGELLCDNYNYLKSCPTISAGTYYYDAFQFWLYSTNTDMTATTYATGIVGAGGTYFANFFSNTNTSLNNLGTLPNEAYRNY